MGRSGRDAVVNDAEVMACLYTLVQKWRVQHQWRLCAPWPGAVSHVLLGLLLWDCERGTEHAQALSPSAPGLLLTLLEAGDSILTPAPLTLHAQQIP